MNLYHLLYYLYGLGWLCFGVWWMYLPHPLNSRLRPGIRTWPTGARIAWGLLLCFTLIQLVWDVTRLSW